MENCITAIFDYKVKKHAIMLAIVFFLLDKVFLIIGDVNIYSHFNQIFFNYLVMVGLLAAISCKNKIDDERSVFIRYSILKNTVGLFAAVFGMIALFSESMKIASLSMLTVLYCIQGLLAFHLLAVFLANKYNPAWLLNEKTASKSLNQLMIGLLYGLYVMAALLFILDFIKK